MILEVVFLCLQIKSEKVHLCCVWFYFVWGGRTLLTFTILHSYFLHIVTVLAGGKSEANKTQAACKRYKIHKGGLKRWLSG